MTQTKHIPATLEMLRMGQVVEVLRYTGEWERKTIEDFSFLGYISLELKYYPDRVRIPLITPEDIEARGWHTDDKLDDVEGVIFHLGQWDMWFEAPEQCFITDGEDEDAVEYEVLTALDLDDLMRLKGITKND